MYEFSVYKMSECVLCYQSLSVEAEVDVGGYVCFRRKKLWKSMQITHRLKDSDTFKNIPTAEMYHLGVKSYGSPCKS